ncbi:hypothetical protein [Arenicella xantha]|uniref:Flagellar motor protein MotB n=1 Tax=Arenicella xantha TaxID=644221 RepID=A0A395JHE3_9GAMM|nr:hypothetical protein [Arenicella xantha]RBP49255.1 hypothetical protein DFR28_104183 [Arenicella xantha]
MSQLDELRQIIVGDSAEQIDQLNQRLDDLDRRTKDVAEVLAPAIDAELANNGQNLVRSLQRPVSLGLKQAIRTEPKAYAEILYPVMAPSIRRAIAQAISSMMVTINRTIESATTVRGVRMRMESVRTGVPYAELALRHSLLYRVEHVYLIDRDSGMLIDEVASHDAQSLDSDAVSAMFSAIQSFVQDSFAGDESARLTDLKVGEHNVWVAHGPRVMLACVILGSAPESLKSELYDTLDGIRSDYATAIEDFTGDNSAFVGVEDRLMPLLQLQLKSGESVSSKGNSATLFIGVLALLALGYLIWMWFVDQSKLSTVNYYLKQTPGVVVTDSYWHDDQIVVEGLRDPDASIPFSTLDAYDISRDQIKMQMIPFRSLETDMELQRFREHFNLPVNVQFDVAQGQITLSGEAPIEWLNQHSVRLQQLVADRRLSTAGLSASLDSVDATLERQLSADQFAQIELSKAVEAGQNVVHVSTRLDTNGLALVQSLFAGSPWVTVNVAQPSL